MHFHCKNRVPDGFLIHFHHIDPRIDGLGPEHGHPFSHNLEQKKKKMFLFSLDLAGRAYMSSNSRVFRD